MTGFSRNMAASFHSQIVCFANSKMKLFCKGKDVLMPSTRTKVIAVVTQCPHNLLGRVVRKEPQKDDVYPHFVPGSVPLRASRIPDGKAALAAIPLPRRAPFHAIRQRPQIGQCSRNGRTGFVRISLLDVLQDAAALLGQTFPPCDPFGCKDVKNILFCPPSVHPETISRPIGCFFL